MNKKQEIIRGYIECTCDEAYKIRRMTDPTCFLCEYESEIELMMDEYLSGSLPLTFEQCLREEFLINTQIYPKEYHNLFNQKFNRARKRFEEQ